MTSDTLKDTLKKLYTCFDTPPKKPCSKDAAAIIQSGEWIPGYQAHLKNTVLACFYEENTELSKNGTDNATQNTAVQRNVGLSAVLHGAAAPTPR